MPITKAELSRVAVPRSGWPSWARDAPYATAVFPDAVRSARPEDGANCQVYAYAVLALFGRMVPPHRSSELWDDRSFAHVEPDEARDLDLVLFSTNGAAWGAHVAVAFGPSLLHLCAEEGRPALWMWEDFAARSRYAAVVGVVRVPVVRMR
ncbi:hydrolase [Humibacter sp.]|uniref:hydrolase n=1 Tax=Humibacter sp. TaxID=1940291 RepID=UPI003F80DD52